MKYKHTLSALISVIIVLGIDYTLTTKFNDIFVLNFNIVLNTLITFPIAFYIYSNIIDLVSITFNKNCVI